MRSPPSTDKITLLNPPNDCLLSFLSRFGCDSSFGSRWRKKSHYSQNSSGFWIQLLSKRLPLTSFNTQSLSQGSGAEIRYFCRYWNLTVSSLCWKGGTCTTFSEAQLYTQKHLPGMKPSRGLDVPCVFPSLHLHLRAPHCLIPPLPVAHLISIVSTLALRSLRYYLRYSYSRTPYN